MFSSLIHLFYQTVYCVNSPLTAYITPFTIYLCLIDLGGEYQPNCYSHKQLFPKVKMVPTFIHPLSLTGNDLPIRETTSDLSEPKTRLSLALCSRHSSLPGCSSQPAFALADLSHMLSSKEASGIAVFTGQNY